MSENTIASFWAWFASVQARLALNFQDEVLTSQLSEELRAVHPSLAWELGPGRQEANALSISPDGDLALLRVSQKVASSAPTLAGWEFHGAKQPREWRMRFKLATDSGELLEVDASLWTYLIRRFRDGALGIALEQRGTPNQISEDDRYRAAIILLDGEIGEASRLKSFDDVEAVAALQADLSLRTRPMCQLREHYAAIS